MKLLSKRVKLCDEGKLQLCVAEYIGSWKPYEVDFNEVTVDWLLEELTYDDCIRKEEIVKYLVSKFNDLEKTKSLYNEMKSNISNIISHLN